MSHLRRAEIPLWLGPGVVADPRAILPWADVVQWGIPIPVGPVRASGAMVGERDRPLIVGTGVGGVEHHDAPALSIRRAAELLRWCASRNLGVVLAVRGEEPGELAEVVAPLCRHLDADALVAIEVDLRGRDDQQVLRSMARVREHAPRDLPLLARLSAAQPDLVAAARAAVAGGASTVVVCGAVTLGTGRWWSGPSTAAHTRWGLERLRHAQTELRWPGARLIAAGGVHDALSMARAMQAGADGVQLGSALLADPTLVTRLASAALATPHTSIDIHHRAPPGSTP